MTVGLSITVTNTPFPELMLSSADLAKMLGFARLMHQLKHNGRWLDQLAARLPTAAAIAPDQPSLLMGYDFHLTDDGPKLIEINNNAGGLFQHGQWLPQPAWSAWLGRLPERLLAMFPRQWRRIAIVDEDISMQPMYPEMQAFAQLLEGDGRQVFLVDPDALLADKNGLCCQGVHIDAIYNRHTDFYLEHATMQHIRTAFEAGAVALNPYPRSYALIGDKSRLADLWTPGVLESVVSDDVLAQIRTVVPRSMCMGEQTAEQWWAQRRQWVFKPAARHGGKGVMRGSDISRKRFAQLDLSSMVAQQVVPPSQVEINGEPFKVDFRLYMHGEEPIALAGRVWQGAVTNFRHPASGWAVINIEGEGG
ncbi:MAG: hypothetical protein R8J85_05945 [Mariprofundales bacterium]